MGFVGGGGDALEAEGDDQAGGGTGDGGDAEGVEDVVFDGVAGEQGAEEAGSAHEHGECSLHGIAEVIAGEAVEQHGHEDEEGEDFEAVAELDEDGDRETREPREEGHAERHEAEASEEDAFFADALAQCREGECV